MSTPINDLSRLKNLGPKSQQMLAAAGIYTAAQLQQLGAVATYAQTKKVFPRASLNLLWALEAGLTNTTWQAVAKNHRTSLLLALEAYEDQAKAFKILP